LKNLQLGQKTLSKVRSEEGMDSEETGIMKKQLKPVAGGSRL
jgi:hypothetical protein